MEYLTAVEAPLMQVVVVPLVIAVTDLLEQTVELTVGQFGLRRTPDEGRR